MSAAAAASAANKLMTGIRRATVRTVVGSVAIVGFVEITTHLPSQGRSSEFYHYVADNILVPAMRTVLNPETAHHVALQMACLAPTYRPSANEQKVDVSVRLWQQQRQKDDSDVTNKEKPQGIVFKNPIGLAAGYDKDATAIPHLLQMGFGFVEIGSVCLNAQPGNPSPRMFRLPDDNAIINRYGFNSLGSNVVEQNLQEFRKQLQSQSLDDDDDDADATPLWERIYDFVYPGRHLPIQQGVLGVNLGKNKTSTTPVEDYQALIRQLGPYADYLVINVSSPNTPGLRDLQATSSLEHLLKQCQESCRQLPSPKPLLVKLSPDLSDDELKELATLFLQLKIDGIILTNTTTSRPASLTTPGSIKQETGGLSGRPLKQRSTDVIRLLYESTQGTIPIVGVGGIENGHDAYDKLKAGASVVQIYSSLIYGGPGLVSRIRDELATIMIENGQRSLQNDVIGIDHEELFWNKQRRALKLKAEQESKMATLIVDEQQQQPQHEQKEVDNEKYNNNEVSDEKKTEVQ